MLFTPEHARGNFGSYPLWGKHENIYIYLNCLLDEKMVYKLKIVLFTNVKVDLLTDLRNPSGNGRFLDFYQP